MPKRTAEEKIERYNRKIRRLQEKQQPKKRPRQIISDSEDEICEVTEEINDPHEAYSYDESVPEIYDDPQPGPSSAPDMTEPVAPVPADPPAETSADTPSVEPINIDPELLAALGDPTEASPEYGANIHENLANLWIPLLKKGMSKESKDKIFQNYPIPDNCRLLQAPKLNVEMSTTVLSDPVRFRDKKLMYFQQQLGHGITAINRAMDVLLTNDNKADALKHLSDSCRILSDFHSMFTNHRKKLISPSVDKSVWTVIQDTERDDTLFGSTLGEKIRSSGTIQKQGLQIKKNVPKQKDNKSMPSTSGRPNQGNWFGPAPRYHQPTSRGGRGVPRRTMMSVVRQPYPPPPALAPHPRMPFSNRPRAPFQ
ncbi:unnamed protein product [Plutella xylostella]|uniref:(diamondback moth) hypothetical protein n=1 Tax=Plutella xylostella TaxID=51655 RepID=A0A8S4GDD3_PLUXY|nr:unnamed protein product [Plutella xylostella]